MFYEAEQIVDGGLKFLFAIAVILLATKTLGLLMRKIGLPQVLGYILAGILIGPAIWGLIPGVDSSWLFPLHQSVELKAFAEVGVILVLFMAGLETDLGELKRTGLVSFLVALGGVVLPLGLGILAGGMFLGFNNFIKCVFIGTIMTATSVGITVETLREMGKLKGRVGTTILSAAIIDDVLGIIVLSIVLSIDGASGAASPVLAKINPNGTVIISVLWMLLFFVLAIGLGVILSKLFTRLEKKHPKTRRQLLYSLVACFAYAFVAEYVFGVADITGAYIAGVILSTNHKSAAYVDKRVNTNTYMIFGPIFFANIGIGMNFKDMDYKVFLFGLVFVLFAILGKIIGCGALAKSTKFSFKDSVKIGVGMIARGEVALIVTQKGIDAGIIEGKYITIVVMLVLVSSILAPILLKLLFKNDKDDGNNELPNANNEQVKVEEKASNNEVISSEKEAVNAV